MIFGALSNAAYRVSLRGPGAELAFTLPLCPARLTPSPGPALVNTIISMGLTMYTERGTVYRYSWSAGIYQTVRWGVACIVFIIIEHRSHFVSSGCLILVPKPTHWAHIEW